MSASIRIVGHRLPGTTCLGYRNIHVGVQRRQEVVDLAPGDADEVAFDVPLDVAADEAGTYFRGPYTHGPRAQRFVYLSWGELPAAGTFAMFRRAKLHLSGLPEHVHAALAAGHAVEAHLDLTDRSGGPLCAAIPPAAIRWTV